MRKKDEPVSISSASFFLSFGEISTSLGTDESSTNGGGVDFEIVHDGSIRHVIGASFLITLSLATSIRDSILMNGRGLPMYS